MDAREASWRLTYVNLVDDATWEAEKTPSKESASKETSEQKNFLALATELLQTMKDTNKPNNVAGGSENSEGKSIKLRNG